MGRDVFDLLDSDMGAVREAVRRDLDARLAAGARIRSVRNGIVIDEWLDGSGTLVAEPVPALAPRGVPQPAPASPMPARRLAVVSGR